MVISSNLYLSANLEIKLSFDIDLLSQRLIVGVVAVFFSPWCSTDVRVQTISVVWNIMKCVWCLFIESSEFLSALRRTGLGAAGGAIRSPFLSKLQPHRLLAFIWICFSFSLLLFGQPCLGAPKAVCLPAVE
jgi:hypothetical protein